MNYSLVYELFESGWEGSGFILKIGDHASQIS